MSNYEPPSFEDYIATYESRIKELEDFIKKARSESELIDMTGNGKFKVVLPYWFMKDDIV